MVELRRTLPDVRLIPYPVQPRNVHVDAWWAHPGTLQLLVDRISEIHAVAGALRVAADRARQGLVGAARQCLNGAA